MPFTSRRPEGAQRRATDRRGFTLIELMITLTVLAVVMVVIMTVMYAAQRSKQATSNRVESAQAARAAMDLMTTDLRSAGYGVDLDYTPLPQPAIAYIDSMQVLLSSNMDPYPDSSAVHRAPLAYNPNGTPKPFPLNGTPWQPPIRYRSGAEVIRWTLDVNNDGVVDASDMADPVDGVDAQRTPNPNDYVLERQVYGDSTALVANNNGPTTQHVALVRRPGGAVPPMFRVYLQGSTIPWDWSNGPIPASRLSDITRVEVNVTATAGRPDWRGQYAETQLHSDVNSLRNTPNFGAKTFAIDGYVFADANKNGVKDGLELGIPTVTMRLAGGMSTTTNSLGYFQFRVPAGTYSLKQIPPWGYGVLTSPDSFVVTVGPGATRSFADTLRSGGWVTAHVWEDLNSNGNEDAGEGPLSAIKVTMNTGQFAYTDGTGNTIAMFAPTGSYTATVTLPDSFSCTTANPASGSMSNGGSATARFGLSKSATGTVSGTVFRDNNADGLKQGGEGGIQNVWVGVSPDDGTTVLGYQYTDASGNYSITVPVNDPPKTKPYSIICIVPTGFWPSTTTSITPTWVKAGQNVSGQDFGMAGFQKITLTASRVLSLASADLIEGDWSGNKTSEARGDADLVLGADNAGTDNISVWFNQYTQSPPFNATRDYFRTAPQSVMCIALDTLDTGTWPARPDMVSGTKASLAGNFFVWYNQDSKNNEGVFPVAYSLGQNYRTSDNGDVQAVLTADIAGTSSSPDEPDIIVGTKSPTAGQGTIEVWRSDNAAEPTFTRLETYPPTGAIPSNRLGEVTGMVLADVDSPPDGLKDLIVVTKTGNYTGQLMIFKNNGRTSGLSRFTYQVSYDLDGAPTAVVVADLNLDGKTDIIISRQTATNGGDLEYWRNQTLFSPDFTMAKKVNTPGIPTSLIVADMGGSLRKDLVMGWRQDETSYNGGVRIYFTDTGTIPSLGIDPSGGSLTNWVPALTKNNFNYGIYPSTPSPPFLDDFAAGVKTSATAGALVVFIR